MTPRKPYPTNVFDEERAFAAPYLTLMTEQAPQRKYDLRLMFNVLRWMARAGGRGGVARQRSGRRTDDPRQRVRLEQVAVLRHAQRRLGGATTLEALRERQREAMQTSAHAYIER